MTEHTITASCTAIDSEERARVLARVYSLLIQLAQEKPAARDEATHQIRATASDISVVETGSHDTV